MKEPKSEAANQDGSPALAPVTLLAGGRKPDNLARTEELFAFLQGTVPDGYEIKRTHIPKLTPLQAWTVIWYLSNLYWQVPDHIERCDVCGNLYDTWSEGTSLDYGKAPYSFCENCTCSNEYVQKAAQAS